MEIVGFDWGLWDTASDGFCFFLLSDMFPNTDPGSARVMFPSH